MCARFSLTAPPELLAAFFGLVGPIDLAPRYNIAPTQQTVVVLLSEGQRRLRASRFGLVPPWATDPRKGPPLINARAETLFSKPAFRGAARARRCLVPATGFYEWRAEDQRKQPILFRRPGSLPFAFAGIFETWRGGRSQAGLFPTREEVHSFAIVTTAGNGLMAPVHDRMPVVVPPELFDRWLDPSTVSVDDLLVAPDDDAFTTTELTDRVNRVRSEGPECWTARGAPGEPAA